MKHLNAEVTRYMMDAMAYAYVGAMVAATGEEPTSQEINDSVRAYMARYCRSEGLSPDYNGIASEINFDSEESYEDEDYEDEDDYWYSNLISMIFGSDAE